MDTSRTEDFSSLPQWVLDLYNPDSISPHMLVKEVEEPDTYRIQAIDFHAMNLYTQKLSFERDYPTTGEAEVFTGSYEDLYNRLQEIEAKVVIPASLTKKMRGIPEMALSFGHSVELSSYGLVNSSYEEFKFCEKAYLEDPENSGTAYNFINTHPMFWYKKKDNGRGRIYITSDEGWERTSILVTIDKTPSGKRETVVMLETGPGNYHDYNLDVYAPTFDDAIVKLAQLIHTHYDSHGGFTDKTKKEPNDNFFREAKETLNKENASE